MLSQHILMNSIVGCRT